MTRGRFKNGRYQQGIGTPETLGVQPTTWNEPKPPALFQAKFDSPSVGFQRNYGSTPDYVDTWKSRWTVPKSGQWIKGATSYLQGKQNMSSSTSPEPLTRPGEDPSVTARRGAW